MDFVDWYNNRHCHSPLKFVTPTQRHRGEDRRLLEQLSRLYKAAKRRHPKRWSGKTRDWSVVGPTAL